MNIRAGDWVEVKSAAEILRTLDGRGEIGAMPFMPEMLKFCGKRLRVVSVAHKTCDVACKTGGRSMPNALHLEGSHCDGASHGGCQAACLMFWKTDWVRRVDPRVREPVRPVAALPDVDLSLLEQATVRYENGEAAYSCQITRLFDATKFLPWWNLMQYVRDVKYRNVKPGRLARVVLLRLLFNLRRLHIGYRATVALHDWAHRRLTGRPTPYGQGTIPAGQPTPSAKLDLKAGEWVAIKPLPDIRATLNVRNANRGMSFDPEMAQFCGRNFKVARRVEQLLDEKTGKMLSMKSPCIVLDGVVCSGDYSERRLFCPRQITPYFREIWLSRQTDGQAIQAEPAPLTSRADQPA